MQDEYGISLLGKARVPKRNPKIVEAIKAIYDAQNLNFSFEIQASELKIENGITCVDASENNRLTGFAVVSIPAYPESKALDLAAEAEHVLSEESLFENARISAELDVDTIRSRIWHAFQECFGDNENGWANRVLLLAVDSVIFYNEMTGKSFKMEYRVEDDIVVITDVYEIAYTRKEGYDNMELKEAMERIAQLEAE